MAIVEILDPKTNFNISYHLDDRLKNNLDKTVNLVHTKDKDLFLALDGKEGSGKSTLALQLGKYIDPTLNLDRVVFSAEEFRKAIFAAKKGQVVIFDEAFTGLSSRAALSGINRALVGLLMQVRQKNLIVIMVLPTFFLLDKYAALFRSKALIHTYENKGVRGYFRLYNYKMKKLLYLYGKKDYSYSLKSVKTKFKGRFYGKFALGDDKMEEKYRKKKLDALKDTEKNPMSAGQVKYKEQRDLFVYLLRKYTSMTYQEIANLVFDYDISLSFQQISKICARFGDVVKVKVPEEEKVEVKEEKP